MLTHCAMVSINLAIEGINLAIDLLYVFAQQMQGMILRFTHEPSAVSHSMRVNI